VALDNIVPVYNVCAFYKIVARVGKGSEATWQKNRTLDIIQRTSIIWKRCCNGAV